MTSMQMTEMTAVAQSASPALLLGADTETTGFVEKKDRIVEIALLDFCPQTGIVRPEGGLHLYLNPERDIPEETMKIHGLTPEFLASQPTFKEKRDEIAAMLEGRTFVAHNAPFDTRMIEGDFALTRARGTPEITFKSLGCTVVDTLTNARQYVRTASRRFTLDALLEHFGVEPVGREQFHGAAVDVSLMAAVYPHIEACRVGFRKKVDALLTESLDADLPADDLKEVARRYVEIESVRKFLDKERDRLLDFFISVNGKKDWKDGRFEANLTESKQVKWEKVIEAHLVGVDLSPFTKEVQRFTLKASY